MEGCGAAAPPVWVSLCLSAPWSWRASCQHCNPGCAERCRAHSHPSAFPKQNSAQVPTLPCVRAVRPGLLNSLRTGQPAAAGWECVSAALLCLDGDQQSRQREGKSPPHRGPTASQSDRAAPPVHPAHGPASPLAAFSSQFG